LIVGAGGCTRNFFRQRADREASEVLSEKDRYPQWRIEDMHVYPDPRARFGDPTNPDRPPMPPDDPAAYDLSPNPQHPGKAGVVHVEGTGYLNLLARWDAENRAEASSKTGKDEAGKEPGSSPTEKRGGPLQEEPRTHASEHLPAWVRFLLVPKPADDDPQAGSLQQVAAAFEEQPAGAQNGQREKPETGASASSTTSLSSKPGARQPYLLKLEQAVELGLINSREYQDAREDLYLTALAVTLERFGFAAQFFAAGQIIRQWSGAETAEGHQNNWTINRNTGFAKLFSTGALLLFNFANHTVVNLTGGAELTSQSMINLDLIQPLLRGGGRAVTLEPLTQAERNLLYEIRTFARFRKTFYVAIAGGGGGSITGATFQPTNVIAPTTFSPNTRLGASGLVPGLIPAVNVAGNPGLQVTVGGSGTFGLQTAFAAPVSGYLSTLLQAAQMRVDEYNIEKLESYLRLARAMEEGGDISQLQVDQFEQQLLNRRTTLLSDQLQYLQSLDQFKLQLNLPTPLPIELDDAPFRPLNQQFQRYEDLFKSFEAASNEPLRYSAIEQVGRVRAELRRIFTSSAIVQGTRFRNQIQSSWAAWEKLSADDLQKQLSAYREERRRILGRQADLETKGQELSAAEQQRLNTLNFEIDLGSFESVLREYEARPWQNVMDPQLRRRQQQASYRYVVNAFILVLAEARNQRVDQLRTKWPDLARLCVDGVDLLKADLDQAETAVVQHALINRLDLMNVHAQLVDAWRQVAVFANALLGAFNVQYHLDSSTPAGAAQPFNFSASRTNQELILNTELPLVRLPERNNYRACLINYQRFRRILMRAEDQVAFDVRSELRTLRQQEENYRIQERQVELAYLTVENSLDTFQAPPQPVPSGQTPPDTATRAAALTTQLINAQTSLYNAQFQMTTIWITYLNTRLQLYRDMELMPLDYRGVWIDETDRECPSSDSAGKDGSGSSGSGGQRCGQLSERQSVGFSQPISESIPLPPGSGSRD
jgi:outer membrane protein TolC